MPRALLAAIAVLVSLSYPAVVSADPVTQVVDDLGAGSVVPGAVTRPVASAAAVSAVVGKVNYIRARHGLRQLRPSPSLSQSSSGFARHLMRVNRFGHAAQIHASHVFRRRGEALAFQRGWRDRPGSAVSSWMGSPPHRALILSRSFGYVGVGLARGRFAGTPATIYVMQFGAR